MTYNSSFTGAQVDAAVEDVQEAKATSPTDTTAGRLLKVGDFGVGGVLGIGGVTALSDSQGIDYTSFWRLPSTAANIPIPSTPFNVLNLASSEATNTTLAMAWSSTVPRAFIRSQITTYTPWRELLHTGNTPIQSNATNLILESGAKLGIGTASPQGQLGVIVGAGGTSLSLSDATNSTLLIKHEAPGNLVTYESGGAATQRWVLNSAERLRIDASGNVIKGGASGPLWAHGTGTPEGAVTAPVGSFYSRTDGGAGTSFYVKESGTGNTGWVAK